MPLLVPTICLTLLTLLLLPACGSGSTAKNNPATSEPTERVAQLMGGWPHAKAITQTGKATAYRITQELDEDNTFKEVIISDGVELTPDQRRALVELLARDGSYEWDVAKGCAPMPGVLVVFEDGATLARLRICYECMMVGFKPGGWEDFDPVYAALVEWAKDVFPDDAVIRGL